MKGERAVFFGRTLPRLAVEGRQRDAWVTMFALISLAVGIVLLGIGVEGMVR